MWQVVRDEWPGESRLLTLDPSGEATVCGAGHESTGIDGVGSTGVVQADVASRSAIGSVTRNILNGGPTSCAVAA